VILYLVSSTGTQRMGRFLKSWAPGWKKRIVVVPYSKLRRLMPLPKGTVIFADIDSLEGSELELAAGLYRELASERPPRMILNEPKRTLTRFDLLEKLHHEGINSFAVRRLVAATETRFPAFLRSENGHRGTLTPRLRNEHELEVAIAHLKRVRLENVLVVEFEDTSDDSGIFRKYSAIRIGQEIVPVHLVFSRYWMQKRPDLLDPSKVEEEHRYLRDNPHRAQLLRLFQAAGAEYGRIDYGVGATGIQTWEIDTNPVIMLEPWQYSPGRRPNARRYAQALMRAFEEIDDEPPPRAFLWRWKRSLVCAGSQAPLILRTRGKLILLRGVRRIGRLPGYVGRRMRGAPGGARS
jgi:hypothetical protein